MADEPREFSIVQNLQAALRAISVPSASYHYQLGGMAVKLDPDHEVEALAPGEQDGVGPPRPFIVLDLSEKDAFEYDTTKGYVRVRRPFRIIWVHQVDPTDDDDLLRKYFRGLADVETAIVPDNTRGGRAADTRIEGREMSRPGANEVWAIVSGEIKWDRPYGSPNG